MAMPAAAAAGRLATGAATGAAGDKAVSKVAGAGRRRPRAAGPRTPAVTPEDERIRRERIDKDPPDPPETPETPETARPTAEDYARRAVTVRAPRPVETGAGVLLGLCIWGVVMNYLRGGPAQARGWILAKLINKPYGGPVGSSTMPPAKPDGSAVRA